MWVNIIICNSPTRVEPYSSTRPLQPASTPFLVVPWKTESSEVYEQCLLRKNYTGQGQNNSLPSLPTSNTRFRPSYVLSVSSEWEGLNPSFIPSPRFCVDSTGRGIQLEVFTLAWTPAWCCDAGREQAEESNRWATLKISGYYSSSTLIVLRLN